MNERTKKLTTMAMFCAVAYVVVVLFRVPIVPNVPFLEFEAKDIFIAIAGFISGPFATLVIGTLVSLLEMITISATGPIGMIMNVLGSCAFAGTAAFVYKKKRTLTGAVVGLILGVGVMTAVMLAWNYLITPIYMGFPRESVAAMLLPVFTPFNLIKGGINAAVTILLYKPIVMALRKAKLVPRHKEEQAKSNVNLGMILVSLFVIISLVMLILVWKGIL